MNTKAQRLSVALSIVTFTILAIAFLVVTLIQLNNEEETNTVPYFILIFNSIITILNSQTSSDIFRKQKYLVLLKARKVRKNGQKPMSQAETELLGVGKNVAVANLPYYSRHKGLLTEANSQWLKLEQTHKDGTKKLTLINRNTVTSITEI